MPSFLTVPVVFFVGGQGFYNGLLAAGVCFGFFAIELCFPFHIIAYGITCQG